ncbi:hypothetical protein FB45DRAFT_199201 [Roridomyces roridus]|uniref:Gag protein n=1 Tax=Roridomyces roridus TaxID=1738132 RepID=A0AAD7CFT9_9AGAR|nr:hypothetical protein FB45DRAFT_199201 [Roridomyces roridus]
MSDSDHSNGPLLTKDVHFPNWQSDAKAFLRRKNIYYCCISSPKAEDAADREKCVGYLWGMLSQDVKPLVKQHEDEPKALWEALEALLAPRKAGARFNAYKTLTSIRLREDETLLSLTGRVSSAMRILKDSRAKDFDLAKADEELHSVVLLMALPDDPKFTVLKGPFEQSSTDLKVAEIEAAYTNHQAFRTAHQEGDTNQLNPLSGLAMAATSSSQSNTALAVVPTVQTALCAFCGLSGHGLAQCYKFYDLLGKPRPAPISKKGSAAAASHVASNTQGQLRT